MVYLVYLQRCLLSIVVIWIQFRTVASSEASEQLSFFWPLLAATMNHIIAGSLHVSFFQMVPLMPANTRCDDGQKWEDDFDRAANGIS